MNLKNYRIKKVTDRYSSKYYPQEKLFGLFWVNMFGHPNYGGRYYWSFEEAQKQIYDFLQEPVVECLEVDCSKCGDTSKTVYQTPNPPPNVP